MRFTKFITDMPIIITNSQYTDLNGSTTNYLRGNVGDPFTFTLDIQESISVSSGSGITLQNNPTTDIVTWLGGSWDTEGFRSGDTITITVYNTSTGVVSASTSTTVDYIQGDEMKVGASLNSWYDFQTETAVLFVVGRAREGMQLDLNLVANGSAGNEFSTIDGSPTRFNFDFKNFPGPTYFGMQFGDRSGMFQVTPIQMVLTSSTVTTREYTLTLTTAISGLYNSGLYSFNNCLKLWAQMSWESLIGEPFDNLVAIYNDDADTGWFGDGFNSQQPEATIVQEITELAYDGPTTGTFVIDSTSPKYAVGSAYVSADENYYKTVPNSQSYLTLFIPTQIPTIGTPISSFTILGRNYTLEITAVTQVGTQWTVDFIFTPNTTFQNWIATRPDGDRTMYVWAKWGNVNLLVFSGQMTKAPAVTKTQIMKTSGYLDHSENVTTIAGNSTGYTANVEDDLAFVGSWLNRFTEQITQLSIKVEAHNATTGDSFTLQQSNVSFQGIPQIAGAYVIDQSFPINTELPTTSVKIDGFLKRDPSIDTSVGYGLKIYFPFLYNWRYWIDQANANADFYPNEQTQNWVPYGNTGTWGLRINMLYDRAGENFQYLDGIAIKNYDSDPNIIQTIELKRASDLVTVEAIIEGEDHRVIANNVEASGGSWDQASVWGMITIEPTESSPRYISSTAIDFDNNTANPLTPLTGLRCSLTFPTPDNARLECFLDPNKINLTNGVKITAKVKGCIWP